MKPVDNKSSLLRIAVQVEKNRAHGRGVLEGIADYARERENWRLSLVEAADLSDTRTLTKYDGFLVRVMDDELARRLSRTGKPVVDIYGRSDDRVYSVMRLDDHAIAETAVECFAQHHFKRCAYCGFGGVRFAIERGSLFESACRKRGMECLIYDGGTRAVLSDSFFRNEKVDSIADAVALRRWLKSLPKPVAIFCCNDLRAVHLLKACEEVGLEAGREVSVLGVDNDVVLCGFSTPSLSSIDTDPTTLGKNAAKMLDEEFENPGRWKGKLVLHPPRGVVERQTTRVDDVKSPILAAALDFIRLHLTDGVTSQEVVTHLGYSHPTVNRLFREELGVSVKAEIARRRLELAKRMLLETDMTAGRVAAVCGYSSPQHFAHTFVSELGSTPDAWRKLS